MKQPMDPYILLSYINTKLRNEFQSLDDLCQSLGLDPSQIITSLSNIGYSYNLEHNAFILQD